MYGRHVFYSNKRSQLIALNWRRCCQKLPFSNIIEPVHGWIDSFESFNFAYRPFSSSLLTIFVSVACRISDDNAICIRYQCVADKKPKPSWKEMEEIEFTVETRKRKKGIQLNFWPVIEIAIGKNKYENTIKKSIKEFSGRRKKILEYIETKVDINGGQMLRNNCFFQTFRISRYINIHIIVRIDRFSNRIEISK